MIYAIAVLGIGLRIVNLISKSIKKLMIKKEMDASLIPFL
ncbi:MAG: hypothetical protein V1783_00360 [Bacteroidota bacterium]